MEKTKPVIQKAENQPRLTLENFSKGMEEVYRKMVIFKREKNSSFVILKDGKITEMNPFEAPDTIIHQLEK